MPSFGAVLVVAVASVFGNRLFSIVAGILLHMEPVWLLPYVILLDILQIPMFYWFYENGAAVIDHLPDPLRSWLKGLRSPAPVTGWMSHVGLLGVFAITALPTLGGGMWSGVLLSYRLGLRKRTSYWLLGAASVLSYLVVYALFSPLGHILARWH